MSKKYYDEERGCYVDKKGKRIDEGKEKAKKVTFISIILAILFFVIAPIPDFEMFGVLAIGCILVAIFSGSYAFGKDTPKKEEPMISDMELAARKKRRDEWDARMKDLEDAERRDTIRRINDYLDDLDR